MDKIISLEFLFKTKPYYALIRSKVYPMETLHHITIMNGELERILYGYHVIVERNGVLYSAHDIPDKEIAELKQSVINAFHDYQARHRKTEESFQ